MFFAAERLMASGIPGRRVSGREQRARDRETVEACKAVLCSLNETKMRLRKANSDFELACDPALIEAAVYEMKALEARFSYFLRKAKELEADREDLMRRAVTELSVAEREARG